MVPPPGEIKIIRLWFLDYQIWMTTKARYIAALIWNGFFVISQSQSIQFVTPPNNHGPNIPIPLIENHISYSSST